MCVSCTASFQNVPGGVCCYSFERSRCRRSIEGESTLASGRRAEAEAAEQSVFARQVPSSFRGLGASSRTTRSSCSWRRARARRTRSARSPSTTRHQASGGRAAVADRFAIGPVTNAPSAHVYCKFYSIIPVTLVLANNVLSVVCSYC